ncbi:hypothetical protein M3573_19515 [Bacillus safensis]|uniref:hypothetical protein n=1 Tax=Bacillus safensis TaxID=561879 RepID=UPI00203D0077|nr:hypothetical protein [Bacillus safensis]MCM3140470.1 hypothetical protein [Bacillus safensis]
MGREVAFIELVTENCEVIKIERQHIGRFRMANVSRSIFRSASNSISDHLEAEAVFLQISSKANVMSAYEYAWDDQQTLPFDRLRENSDIVAIDVTYKDGGSEYIYVKWDGDNWTNDNQTVAINENTGDLFVVISEETTAEDHFEHALTEENRGTFWKTLNLMEALK